MSTLKVKFLTGIEIGNTKTTSYEKVVYRNQKLKSGQLYQFSIAAYNSAGPRELRYSPPMTNMAPSNGAVIAATIIPIRKFSDFKSSRPPKKWKKDCNDDKV